MIDVVVHAFTTLFVVIDPLGLVPLLLALTVGMPAVARRRMALRGVLIAAIILLGFALLGDPLLGLLGIGLPAFRTAGGVMLLLIALEMVFERRIGRRSRSADELRDVGGHADISVFPLAIPLLSGPGAITSIMLLTAQYEGDVAAQAAVIAVLLVVMALCAGIFLFVEPIERLLGPTLTLVISRLLGILLAALAVQYVFDGLRHAFNIGAG
ncbi:MAG TPA: MarC family protein [Geminicoccaceae bacterium]|nr:MarC family protein [Geminicoccaceae bacterium]